MLTWTPDPATSPWYDAQADEVWTQGPITAIDTEALLTVIGYSGEVIGPEPPAGLIITADANGVTVSAPNALADVFPAVDIEYQINGETGHCATFAAIPTAADEIIHYLPSPSNTKDWTIRVTAHCIDALTDLPAADASADFVVRVYANYDTGRDALKEFINARRR